MLLSIVLGVVLLALVMVLGSIASIHLERKQLLDLADALAADAADALDTGVYFADPGTEVALSDASVADSVRTFLETAPESLTGTFEGLRVVSATTPDGATARVHVSARARPVLIPWVLVPWSEGFTIEAVSHARAH